MNDSPRTRAKAVAARSLAPNPGSATSSPGDAPPRGPLLGRRIGAEQATPVHPAPGARCRSPTRRFSARGSRCRTCPRAAESVRTQTWTPSRAARACRDQPSAFQLEVGHADHLTVLVDAAHRPRATVHAHRLPLLRHALAQPGLRPNAGSAQSPSAPVQCNPLLPRPYRRGSIAKADVSGGRQPQGRGGRAAGQFTVPS